MRSRAAAALAISLALPAFAQHNGAHGGSSPHVSVPAHSGFTGQVGSMGHGGYSAPRAPGYSGFVGMERPSSFSPPGRFPLPGQLQPPARNGMSVPFRGNNLSGGRYPYRPQYTNRYPNRYPYHNHDNYHHGGHNHFVYAYPGLYGYPYYSYPYVIDPGFYNWGLSDYSDNQQGANDNSSAYQTPGYTTEPPYPDEGPSQYQPHRDAYAPAAPASAPVQLQEYHFTDPNSQSTAGPPLTVIFKDHRTPLKVQNYMVNSTSLTDLDREHFEKIPLDQVDIAATAQTNRQHGIDFQVPIASHD